MRRWACSPGTPTPPGCRLVVLCLCGWGQHAAAACMSLAQPLVSLRSNTHTLAASASHGCTQPSSQHTQQAGSAVHTHACTAMSHTPCALLCPCCSPHSQQQTSHSHPTRLAARQLAPLQPATAAAAHPPCCMWLRTTRPCPAASSLAAAAMPCQRSCCGWRTPRRQWPCPRHTQCLQAAWTTGSLTNWWARWAATRPPGGAPWCCRSGCRRRATCWTTGCAPR